MMEPKFTGRPITAQHMMTGGGRADFVDLDQMPDTPNRGRHHRRTQSDTFLRFDDDITLDDAVFDLPPAPSLSSEAVPVQLQPRPPAHLRSLSVDADFFEGLNFGPTPSSYLDGGLGSGGGGGPAASGGGFTPRHRHSNSMDGSFASAMTTSFEALMVDSEKKTSNADRLHEIALNDPKRAKRILANRQSAARSKERKIHYTSELERQVQTLQTEATTLSAQVTQLQRDTSVLTVENKELKLHLESMEKQAQLRDALNEKLKEEVQRLKIEAGQMRTANGSNFGRGLRPQFPPQMQTFSNFGNSQADHHQQQQQRQLPVRMPQSVMNSSAFNSQAHPSFLGFNPNA